MSESLLNEQKAYVQTNILKESISHVKLMVKFYSPLLTLALLYLSVPFFLDIAGFSLFPVNAALNVLFSLIYVCVLIFFVFLLVYILPKYALSNKNGMSFSSLIDYLVIKEKILIKFMHAFIIIAIMGVLQISSLGVKGNITAINPFSWDEFFMKMDRIIHANIDPWKLFAPFFGNDLLVKIMDVNYEMVWFTLLIGSWLFMAVLFKFNSVNIRYILAYAIAWIIGGNLLAIVFSSAGPAFYAKLGHSPDVYAPLFEHLRAFGALKATSLQDGMWQNYVDGAHPLGGISAFPSMHNAIAVLLALFAWKHSRIAGILVTVHAVLVFIGSIYLGWHYAVDAYAGIAVAFFSWWLAGRLAKRLYDTPEAERLRKILYG